MTRASLIRKIQKAYTKIGNIGLRKIGISGRIIGYSQENL